MAGGAGVIALGHQHDIAVLDRHGFVQAAVVGIDALEAEALRRVEAVVVGLFQMGFARQVVPVVLVWRVARRIAGGRDDLDDEQRIRRLVLGQDVGDVAGVRALAADLLAEIVRADDADWQAALEAGCRADREFQIGRGGDRPVGTLRQINRPGLALERAHPLAEFAERLATGRDLALAGDEDEAGLAGAGLGRDGFARLQAMHIEADIGPAGAFRRDMGDAAARALRLDLEMGHRLFPIRWAIKPVRLP